MKIIALQFRNINNLKGDHSISFEQMPLSTASIFAIVGPTGSGKSTILDVITLALFNRIPRFSKAISKNEITKEASILTHHTKEALASIEYEIKGQRYKSVWNIQSNRNGKLKDYEMTFYNPDGSVEDLKKSEVPSKNEEIIGLKYDQFVKAILLSQGEFAKFLKADKNERGSLLENLTGTSVYRKIGLKTYEKYKGIKEDLEKEKDLLGENSVLAKEARTLLQEELKTSQKVKQELDKELASLAKQLNIKTEKQRLSTALDSKKNERSSIEIQSKSFEAEKLRLSNHHKLSHLQGPFTTYKNAKENADKSRSNLADYKKDLAVSQKQLQSTIDKMGTLTKEEVNKDNFKKVMAAFEAEITSLDKDIEHLKNNGSEARANINKELGSYPITLSDKADQAIIQLGDREEKLKTTITRARVDSTKSLPDLRKEQAVKSEELDKLKTIQNLVKNIETLNESIQVENKNLNIFKEEIDTVKPLISKTQTILSTTNEKIVLLRKQKLDALKIAELEEHRSALQPGEACPLCGSVAHPYTKHLPQQQNEIDKQIDEAEVSLKDHQDHMDNYKGRLQENKKAEELTLKAIQLAQAKLSHEQSIYQKETTALKLNQEMDMTSITQLIASKTLRITQKTDAIAALTELEQNKRLYQAYLNLQNIAKQYRSLKKQREDKFEGTIITDITNKLQDDFQNADGKIIQLIAVIEKDAESLKRDEDLVLDIAKGLEPKITSLGFTDINDIASNLLNESTLNKLTKIEESLKANTIKIKTEITSLEKDLLTKQKEDINQQLSIEEIQTSFDDKKEKADKHNEIAIRNAERLTRDDADRSKIKEREKTIEILKEEYNKWSILNNMIGDATGNKFANFAQGLTLQNLLVYANRRLTKLTDRYLLNKPTEDGSLFVIDKYHGDSARSVKTLSGGETFLISLALALSLSDMASKNVTLGCLFIDEGFGTLDRDTLELAMTTLETLQSESQKTVGVISHVEALKERIHVQLRLIKNAQGFSRIEIN